MGDRAVSEAGTVLEEEVQAKDDVDGMPEVQRSRAQDASWVVGDGLERHVRTVMAGLALCSTKLGLSTETRARV